jgi:hypothetical protein
MSPRTRQLLLNLLRIGLSVGLLTYVLWQIDWQEFQNTLQNANPWPYLGALGLGLVGVVLRAWRWKVLLDAVNLRVNFRRLVYLYFVGAFYNSFLPTGFGGDVVRVLEFGPHADRAVVTGTTIVDRLTGFVMLFVLALVALPFSTQYLPPGVIWPVALAGIALLVGTALLFEGKILRTLTSFLPGPLSLSGEGWLARTFDSILRGGRGGLWRALGISVLFNLVLLTAAVLLTQALQINVSIAALFVFVPIATASLLLPSISGLGVRETMYQVLFAQVGVGGTQATAFSLAYYSIDLFAGIVGGLLYFITSAGNLRQK